MVGDGTLGWPAEAPYDRILVAAAASQVPPALVEQLAEGGTLVIPVGQPHSQVLEAHHKVGGQLFVERLSGCRFVPLVGRKPTTPEAAGTARARCKTGCVVLGGNISGSRSRRRLT